MLTQFEVGDAYLDFERTGQVAHLWIVIAAPLTDPDERAIASITSDGPHIVDRSCVLAPGDHPFVRTVSVVVYRKAAVVTVADLRSWDKRGNLKPKERASESLIDRMRAGALASPFTPRYVQAAIRQCNWVTPAGATSDSPQGGR